MLECLCLTVALSEQLPKVEEAAGQAIMIQCGRFKADRRECQAGDGKDYDHQSMSARKPTCEGSPSLHNRDCNTPMPVLGVFSEFTTMIVLGGASW